MSLWLIVLAGLAWADVTISGTQIRGRGTNGILRCTGVRLENPGTITGVQDAGAGFWLQSDTGQLLRFNTAEEALGTTLTPGTWYAYPNLYQNHDEDGVSVIVGTGTSAPTGGGSGSAPLGTWRFNANGYAGYLKLTRSGSELRGRLYFDISKKWETLTDLTWSGGVLRFTRPWAGNPTFQRYQARFSGSSLSGSFTDNNSPGQTFNWSGRVSQAVEKTSRPKADMRGASCCAWAQQRLACSRCNCKAVYGGWVCNTLDRHGNPHGSCPAAPECGCICGHAASEHR